MSHMCIDATMPKGFYRHNTKVPTPAVSEILAVTAKFIERHPRTRECLGAA
jgi:hypothetical protein